MIKLFNPICYDTNDEQKLYNENAKALNDKTYECSIMFNSTFLYFLSMTDSLIFKLNVEIFLLIKYKIYNCFTFFETFGFLNSF